MMQPFKITVVTSAYNAASYIGRCLESVHDQVWPADSQRDVVMSHWVIDAGSKDGSVGILERWKAGTRPCVPLIDDGGDREREITTQGGSADSRTDAPAAGRPPASRYAFDYLTEPDRGQCDGFNKGVRVASGEWICWLNADDELEPGAIRAFMDCLEAHADADVIYGHTRFIDDQSRPLKTSYHIPFHPMLLLNAVYAPPSSGTFFRRNLLLEHPLDVEYHYVMDTEWFMRCRHQIHAVLADNVMCRFRISNQGKTSGQIQTGICTAEHQDERVKMLRKYVFPRWPELDERQAGERLARYRSWSRVFYYFLKSRYLPRYVTNRFFPGLANGLARRSARAAAAI